MQTPDFVALSHVLAQVTEKTQKIVGDFLHKSGFHPESESRPDWQQFQGKLSSMNVQDSGNISGAFMELGQKMLSDPQKMYDTQVNFMSDAMQLWQNTAQRLMGENIEPMIEPHRADRRFTDETWSENPWFDFIKQYYLLASKHLSDAVKDVKGFDKKTSQKVDFYTQQYIDALSPSNFLITNPEVLKQTLESGGENLLKGLQNLIEDYERGEGKLAISMTDYDAFEVGKNIATTPGKVIFQNNMLQLIQYSPSTDKVAKKPLLITPPWINKYYILDLSPKNSFVKWAVDQGHTVFLISWVNPDESYKDKGFEDYMLDGVLAAAKAVQEATGEKDMNVIGYCIGGTLLGITLAYLAEKPGKDNPFASATYFTTMLNFKDPGDLGVFIDEKQISSIEASMEKKGYLDGSEMAATFNMLKANDLIWYFVVNNYLLGKEPFPFDLLFWNSDSTRLPAAMHSYYLRNMYLHNKLCKANALKFDGVPIDLAKVKAPTFMISTKSDHIAPWESTYEGVNLFKNTDVKFVLAASGHIAGVVNPPAKNKYCYWETPAGKNPEKPKDWLATANQHEGSWWPAWQKWISGHSGGQVPARKPGDGKLKPIENAPGSYVKAKS